jgi:hypothetical protein
MEDTSTAQGAGGLFHFDLPTVFRCGVELAEATSALDPSEWADLPVDIEGPASPHFARWTQRHDRLRRIEEETKRLKLSLGARGPLEFRGGETDGGPKWDSYDERFNNTVHERVIRLSLLKLATAAIDLSGFATWREWQWPMRETGLRLLAWGLAQLWEGMTETERSKVRDRLSRTHKAIGWPANLATDPPAYDGPDEIPLPDQYRIIANYVSCHRDYLDDVQKAENMRVEQGQEKFLRRATLVQFVEAAQRAEQSLQAMAKRDFDSPAEWGELYTKAFWPLACLRRANEILPRESWPAAALAQRKVLADAAGILLTCVGGTPEAKAGLKPEDADKAFEQFSEATRQLRNAIEGLFIERLLAGPDDAELSPRELALLEAHLRQPVSFATIQQEKKATGHSPTEAARNKLKLIRDFNRALQGPGDADEAETREAPAPAVTTDPAPKRSTERGEGRAKLIAALTKHHQYADGGCLNLEPIGNNELAKAAGVSPSTASAFFNDKFQGHTKYKALSRDAAKLTAALKLLNDEFAPYLLLGAASSDLAAPDEADDE